MAPLVRGTEYMDVDDDDSDDVRSRSAIWIIEAALVYRAVIIPMALAAGYTSLGDSLVQIFVVGGFLVSYSGVVLIGFTLGHWRRLYRSRIYLCTDVAIAFGANVWTASIVATDTWLLPYRDPFWFFATGSIAAWTAAKGARLGWALLVLGAALQPLMVHVNGSHLNEESLIPMAARVAWLSTGVVFPLIIASLARRSGSIAASEAHRTGRAIERTRALRSLHDTVLQALAQISRWSVWSDGHVNHLKNIRSLAVNQCEFLSRAMDEVQDSKLGLLDGLEGLVRTFDELGLKVELVRGELAIDSEGAVADALTGAVRESLSNVLKHAQVSRAVLRVANVGDRLEIVVRDHGRGFDLHSVKPGFGLSESIGGRLRDVGAESEVWSAVGRGTEVRVSLQGYGLAHDIDDRPSLSRVADREASTVEALASQAIDWFVIAALAYRIALSPLLVLGAITNLDIEVSKFWVSAMVVVLIADIVLLAGLVQGWLVRFIRSKILVIADLSITAVLNLWTATALPANTVMRPGAEVFWGYTLGAMAFWMGLRGVRFGALLVGLGFILQLLMARLNETLWDTETLLQFAARQGWLIAGFGVVWLLMSLARRVARKAVENGLRAGKEIQRAWILRDLYRDVQRSVRRIVDICDSTGITTKEKLIEIRGRALAEIDHLRMSLGENQETAAATLGVELEHLARTFRSQGLRVELVTDELSANLPDPVLDAMIRGVRESLVNVMEHAGISHVVVRASDVDDGVEIVIRDRGSGFSVNPAEAGPEIKFGVLGELEGSGVESEVWSESGRGTRVRFHWRA